MFYRFVFWLRVAWNVPLWGYGHLSQIIGFLFVCDVVWFELNECGLRDCLDLRFEIVVLVDYGDRFKLDVKRSWKIKVSAGHTKVILFTWKFRIGNKKLDQ